MYDGEDLHRHVTERFATEIAANRVRLLRKLSDQVTRDEIPPGSLDLLYIDGGPTSGSR